VGRERTCPLPKTQELEKRPHSSRPSAHHTTQRRVNGQSTRRERSWTLELKKDGARSAGGLPKLNRMAGRRKQQQRSRKESTVQGLDLLENRGECRRRKYLAARTNGVRARRDRFPGWCSDRPGGGNSGGRGAYLKYLHGKSPTGHILAMERDKQYRED